MRVTEAAAMQSALGSGHQKSHDSGPSAPCALWPVDLKLTHLDWNPEATLIHFQGQYLTICELDYNILQTEIQNAPKTKAAVEMGEFCLVEDLTSGRWYRGRVQNRKEDLFDVFLVDRGNVLSVGIANISSCSNDLFLLPPKIVCGFLANVVLLQGCPHSVVEEYFSNLIGKDVTGYIQALLPHKVLLLEIPDINMDLVKHGFGTYMDTDTFLLLVEMLTEVPLKQNVDPVPDLLIEKQRGQEFCFKPSHSPGYQDILSFYGPRLSCGTRAKVRVTAAVNPGLFYCQMTSMETDLLEMSKKLAAVCEHRSKERKTPENLGLLCAVNSKDGKWYRGFVQFLPVNSQVRVLFVDYGYYESIKVENVHRLPPDFDSTPIMALQCSLFSLSDQDEEVKTQQLSFLKAGLLGRALDVEIRSFDKEKHLYSIAVIAAEDSHMEEPEPIQEPHRMNVESVFETETKEMPPQGGYLYYETIMGEALGRTLESEEVQVGSVFVGYVEYVQNPNRFWIRTQKRNNDFEEMMTQMKDHFSQVKLDEDVLLNPALGTLCCAVYEEDMHFYRAVVTDTLDHGAEVLFIDFGNLEKVPHMLIKKIPEMFARKPPFAFCCSLVNIFPSDDIWTSNTTDVFRKAVSNKPVLVHVVQMRNNKFAVDLFEMGGDNNQSITEIMISSKQGEFWKKMQKNSPDVTEKTKCQTDISGNTEQWSDCETEDKTCKHETEEAEAPAYFRALNIKPGYELAVRCFYVTSPSDFWCQPLDKVPALEEMMDKVQLYYSTHTVALPSADLCCVAKLPLDGCWYRARVIKKQEGHAIVFLVDYGLIVQIKEDNLQPIIPEHVCLEGQAFRCSLYNLIEPADPKSCGDWRVKAGDSLKGFVRDSTCHLRCKVRSQFIVKNKGLCNAVDLYNTQTQQSITDLLLEQGLAEEVTVPTKQLSAVLPESFVFSSYDQSPGKEEEVCITHVSSHWEVYYHLERNTDIIEELEEKISEESKKMMQAGVRPVVNNLYLAKYFDGKWYRGYAHPLPSPLHLNVFFVDYGNTNISEKTDVMLIPRDSADLLYTPMQAVRCSLTSVSKEGLYTDVKEWLEGAILNKQVRAAIVGKNEDGSFDVELFDGEVSINEKVRELIVSHLPKPQTGLSFDVSSTKATHKTPLKKNAKTSVMCRSQHGGCYSNSHSSNAHNMRQVGSTPPKKKVNAQRKNTNVKNQNEHSTKSRVPPVKPRLPRYHDTNTKSEQPQFTEKIDIPQLMCLPDTKVTEGFRATCFVSHIDSVNSFFLQLSEDETAILKMVEDLNSDSSRGSMKTATSLRVNDLVLAEYEEDRALYRSVVKDCEGSSGFKVEFLDYGNSAVTGMEKIYCIPEEYLSQPRLSILCSLLDSSTYENDVSFIDAVMEKPLMVDFVHQCGTHWKVKVEILDEAVGAAPLEAAVESSTETKTQEEPPASSSEIVESSGEQKYLRNEESENETTKSKTMMPAADGENLVLEPPPANQKPPPTILKPPPDRLSSKLKAITYKCYRPHTRNKRTSKKNQSKIMTSSVKAKNDSAHGDIPLTVQAKDTESCRVLSVLRNGNFYVRLNRTEEQLSALEERIINNLYKCEVVAEDDVKEGLKCLVQVHKDKQWRRAVVQHVCQGKSQVFLVDHAIRKEIPSGSIRRQCINLSDIPNLAVLCKVNCSGLREEEGAHKSLCETMKPMVDKEVKLLFVCYSEADKLWEVEVIMTEQYLIHHITTLLQQNEETNPSLPENRNEQTEGKSSATSQPERLEFAPIDLDKAYSGSAAAVTSPFEFCVVLEDSSLIMDKVSIMLDDLPGQVSPLPEAHLIPGACCLLKSDTKNKWCRAEIVHSDIAIILKLADYSDYECMPYEDHVNLKRLPAEMTSLPKVMYPCVLRGVKPDTAGGQWTDEAAVFFQQCLYQKNLQIFFREFVSNTHWKVDVVVDDIHVAKKLVDAGHASYIDVMLGLRFQKQSLSQAAAHRCDHEEDCGQEEEVLDRKSDLHVDEALSIVSGPKQCLLM